MKNILIVENSKFIIMLLKNKIELAGDFKVIWTQSLSDAVEILDNKDLDFFACVLDYHLPDARHGAIIDVVVGKKIPAIIFTDGINQEIREKVWSKLVVDYVLHDDRESVGPHHFLTQKP